MSGSTSCIGSPLAKLMESFRWPAVAEGGRDAKRRAVNLLRDPFEREECRLSCRAATVACSREQ
eukprot:scaffold216776_cov35-Prasinocladus_malaysianus.AAC.1